MKVVVTGAAGLVGQNLIARLKETPGIELVGIDKHPTNTALLRRLHTEADVIEADLARTGDWEDAFSGADAVVVNQAQIGGLVERDFIDNNVVATANVIAAMRRHTVPYFVLISSSVVNSAADDFYTRSKTAQERLADQVVDIPHVVLRPTLMFGWFDRKHLGWLRRFMDKSPVFPVPGNGRYIRQPLYVGDFAGIIVSALRDRVTGTYDISGQEQVYYGDLIRLIRNTVKARSLVINIPYRLFLVLLAAYARIDANPPFTTSQLKALVIPETFPTIDWPGIFKVRATPLEEAIRETYLHSIYGKIVLDF